MLFTQMLTQNDPLRKAITAAYCMDETTCLEQLLPLASLPTDALERVSTRAYQLVLEVRKQRLGKGGLDAFLHEYDLSSEEGIALMCLAEALLRIPDQQTRDRLIEDKITTANWAVHAGQSESVFVNAATWGLMLTGKLLEHRQTTAKSLSSTLMSWLERAGEPVIRQAVGQAMKVLGKQFVMGESINTALKRAKSYERQGYRFSYDMLGEAARTAQDAERYFHAYQAAISAVGVAAAGKGVIASPGISVKLSALHPRYEFAQRDRVIPHVSTRLLLLAQQAKAANIGLTVDAEEAERLDLSLDIIERVFADDSLQGWEGFGLAVQSYQKRAPAVIDWLAALAAKHERRLMVRLIKGAYWDTEIKLAQVRGLLSYPVFTRKASTDVSFLACAKKLLAYPQAFYPQFATHNAYTLAAVLEMAGERRDFEFQCLHGMGYTLYDQVVGKDKMNIPCRVYAPVGGHEDLLAYLVRRLLENGANSSFVNRIVNPEVPINAIIADPAAQVKALADKPHPHIPLPRHLYGCERLNSQGLDLTNWAALETLKSALLSAVEQEWQAVPTAAMSNPQGEVKEIYSPADKQKRLGTAAYVSSAEVEQTLSLAAEAVPAWQALPMEQRAGYLDKAADLFEQHQSQLMAMLVYEAGKTLPDALAEVREATDFCRYYAAQARKLAEPLVLPGPTGESNELTWHGRGTMLCISPWNFPLAIFTGQVVAALVTGNTVIAKPAAQTPLIAARAVQLMHAAGIPQSVVQLLPGRGEIIGNLLLPDERVKGVIFTGSTQTARHINQTLAARSGAIVPLIAETGGQNAMIVDSSALPEQVVMDIVASAFGSAGQRCSALRVVFIQEDIAPKLLTMLQGAMQELVLAEPSLLTTDIGPVIDDNARKGLQAHVKRLLKEGKLLYQVDLPKQLAAKGSFFAPCAIEIDSLECLTEEVFGPVLHIIRYKSGELANVTTAINATGYGLTLGIHSRINATIKTIQQHTQVGNTYVNRTMIGAVVGVQPFGGEGLSGTGPKAGGPHYLQRLCVERCISINTTAAGGNASLMSLAEEPGI